MNDEVTCPVVKIETKKIGKFVQPFSGIKILCLLLELVNCANKEKEKNCLAPKMNFKTPAQT
jgi:hypothetical protein